MYSGFNSKSDFRADSTGSSPTAAGHTAAALAACDDCG